MNGLRRRLLIGFEPSGGAACLLLAIALSVHSAEPSNVPTTPPPKPADQFSAEEQFENPDETAARFKSELAKLWERTDLAAPADLAKQAEAYKTCRIETLPDPKQKFAPEAIYAKARRSVVIVGGIVNSRGKKRREDRAIFATGFVIRKDGVIVTNCHVAAGFADFRTVGVMTDDGRMFAVKSVLAADSRNDVAALKIEADNLTPLPIAETPPVGTVIYCLSHPALNSTETLAGFYTFTEGIVSGKFRMTVHGNAPLNVMTVTNNYAKGSSGGPMLNEHGAVVGMVCETVPLYGDVYEGDVQMVWKYARPSGSILAILREDSPVEKPAEKPPEKPAESPKQ
jgi:serine protease Do